MAKKEGFDFNSVKFPTPAISNYWEIILNPPQGLQDPNIVDWSGKQIFPASSVTFDTGELEYQTIDIFWEKIKFLKFVKPISQITVNYIESEDFLITKIHKQWFFEYKNSKDNYLFRKYGVGMITKDATDFAGHIKIIKYKKDFKTKALEFEAEIIPTGNLSFNFDYGDSVLEKSITYDVVDVVKFEIY